MRTAATYILILGVAASIVATAALAEQKADQAKLSASVQRQLELKRQLRAQTNGQSLAQLIDHNRRSWDTLTPDQQSRFRKHALAFLHLSEEEQRKLLRRYERLIRMTAEKRRAYRQRAQWLKAVVKTLSADERQELREMPPKARAARLIELRDQLVAEGRLELPEDQGQSSQSD
jgi:hypothetical protein